MRVIAWILFLLLVAPSGLLAQEPVQLADRGPRFLLASTAAKEPTVVDARKVTVLRKRISIDLEGVTLEEALTAISRQAGLRLMYSKAVVPLESRVRLQAKGITVAGALTEVLFDAGVDVLLTASGQAVLTVRTQPARVEVQVGSVVGRVTDAKTGQGLEGAEVLVDGTRLRTLTGTDGQYRLTEVDTGSYVVSARRIGYAKQSRSITVGEGETTADFALAKSVQQLEEVVTTGTATPTEVKALPSPITIITAADFAERNVQRFDQVLRQVVPSAIAWNLGVDVEQTAMSVRGATSLSGGGGAIKVYLDGIELGDRTNAAIDPSSIERIEVIRGPEAAALYGSGAIGGVMQVFTKRGDPSRSRPQVEARAGWGVVESPYSGSSGALRQDYGASMRGGWGAASYNIGGTYTKLGDWVIEGGTSLPSIYGGVHLGQGPLNLDLSARYYITNTNTVLDPRLTETGFTGAKPFHRETQYRQQTYGARLTYAVTPRWHHHLIVGNDGFTQDIHSSEPRLTTPADTLLFVQLRNRTKSSVAYNTSLTLSLSPALSATLTGGIDHYRLNTDGYFTQGALGTTGTISSASPVTANRNSASNTGYFAQAQLGLHDALFLNGAVRIEQNSGFGISIGSPVSPRVGLAYTRPVGPADLKIRASYGKALQPPDPGQREASVGSTVQLENPNLGPVRQAGWDAGVDLVFGNSVSFSATYYDQRARGLIQFVQIQAEPRQSQFQNVGQVTNRGIELEGTGRIAGAELKAQYAYTRSRLDDLGLSYTGDLRVGDQALLIPRHTAGASLSLAPLARMTATAGLTYVGSWTYYDTFAQFGCFAGTTPCRSSNRDYIIEYPGFVKLNASVNQEIGSALSAFLSVENLTNNHAWEFTDIVPVMGRMTTFGMRVRY